MQIITLTSDIGLRDYYVASVKGQLLQEVTGVQLIDITHYVKPFEVAEAAYQVRSSYSSFPAGTIHIIGVDSEISETNKHIALALDNHFFVCPDNGLICMITKEIKPTKVVEINIHDKIETSFPVLDVFVKVACHIARGGTLAVIGKSIDKIKPIKNLEPYVNEEKTQIIGSIIYVDNYDNVITNIKKSFFETI